MGAMWVCQIGCNVKVTERTLKTLSQDTWELLSIHIESVYMWEQIINVH